MLGLEYRAWEPLYLPTRKINSRHDGVGPILSVLLAKLEQFFTVDTHVIIK